MNWWFTESRRPKRCMHIAYKRHPDFPNTHETRNRECLFEAGHDGPHLFQYPCDKSELCLARPHDPACPVAMREYMDKHANQPYQIPHCTRDFECKADFHDPECLTYLEEQEKREVHNTSGGLTERCAWRDYLKGGRNRCVLKAGHDDHHKLSLCRGDCGDIDCPDCDDADRDLLDSPKVRHGQDAAEYGRNMLRRHGSLDCGCTVVNGHLEVPMGGCTEGHTPGEIVGATGGLVDEPDEGVVTAEGFGTKPGKLRSTLTLHTKDYGTEFPDGMLGTNLHEQLEQFNAGGQLGRANVSHYTTGEIETIDYIYDKLGLDGGHAYVLGNILKYASRAKHKGQFASDIEKIRNYAVIMQEQERKRS